MIGIILEERPAHLVGKAHAFEATINLAWRGRRQLRSVWVGAKKGATQTIEPTACGIYQPL